MFMGLVSQKVSYQFFSRTVYSFFVKLYMNLEGFKSQILKEPDFFKRILTLEKNA